jgi:hypothetical protein
MDNKFLLTFLYENIEGMYSSDFNWYATEEEMIEDIEFKKDTYNKFKIIDAIEIIGAREVEYE